MGMQASLLYADLNSFGYTPCDIGGSYSNSDFSFLRNFHTDLHRGYTNLHSHQWCIRVLCFLVICSYERVEH
jgi:hypothetical protein